MSKERKDIDDGDKWNVESVYATVEDFEKDFEETQKQDVAKILTEKYQSKLKDLPASDYYDMHKLYYDYEQKLSKLYVYATLRKDENLNDTRNKENYKKIEEFYTEFSSSVSWMNPELVNLPDEKIKEILESEEVKDYRLDIERTVRMKKHTRSKEIEELLTLAYKPIGAISSIFSNFTDAELPLPKVKNSKNEELELTHAKYSNFIKSPDRELRKNAFLKYHETYKKFQGTICEIMNGVMQRDLFFAKAKKYPDCITATLFPRNISPDVYKSLISTTRKHSEVLQKYVNLRKKILKVEELHLYDLYVPLIEGGMAEKKYSFEECISVVIEAAGILGKEYQSKLAKGLTEERWVDKYENKGKRSGGYSCSHYDTYPFILLNYTGDIEDVFTTAHEGGHSMHSKLSDENNKYQYSGYSNFVAEVASEFQECLLFHKLMGDAEKEGDKRKILYLLNKEIEAIRTTFFRQVLFAEFELLAHQFVEEKKPLTPELMNKTMTDLYIHYYKGEEGKGKGDIIIDKEVEIEWARIPHFFLYRFYVYQYATGITAAISLSEMVINGGEEERKRYLKFLCSGCTKWPLDLLRDAGIDLATEKPFLATIKKFERLLEKFEKTYFEYIKEQEESKN